MTLKWSNLADVRGCRGITRRDVLGILAAVFLLSALFLASTCRKPNAVARVNCVAGLKQIGLAFRCWAEDHGDKFPMQVPESQGGSLESTLTGQVAPTFTLLSNELISPKILLCPDDRERFPRPQAFESVSDQKVSYFIALDADPGNVRHVLTGDRNIGLASPSAQLHGLVMITDADTVRWTKLLHGGAGNVGFADKSAQQATTRDLQKIMTGSGFLTNRLVFPDL